MLCLANLPLSATSNMQISLSLLQIKKKGSVSNCDLLVAKATENGLLATRLSITYSCHFYSFIYLFFCFNHFIPSTGDFFMS